MNRKIKRHKSYDYSGSQTSLLSFRRLVRPCSKTFTPAYRYYESGQRSLPFCGFRQGGRLTRRERGHRGEVTLDNRGLNKQTYCSLQRRDFIQNISRSTKFESKTESTLTKNSRLHCTNAPEYRDGCSQHPGIRFPTPGNPVPNAWESCSQRPGILFPTPGSPVPVRVHVSGLPAGGRNRKGKSRTGAGDLSHTEGERTQRRNQHRCAEKGTLGREKKQEKKRRKGKADGADVIYHFPSMYSTEEPEEINKTSLLTTRRGGRSSLIVPEPIKVVPLGTGDTRAVSGVIVYISLVRPFGMV